MDRLERMPDLLAQSRIHLRGSGGIQFRRRFNAVSNDLGTDTTSRAAFLPKPAAIGSNAAGGKRLDDRRHELHKASGKAAVGSVEVAAGLLLAWSGEAENLGGHHRCGEGEQIAGHRHRFFNPCHTRTLGASGHDTESHAARDVGLRTGAEDRSQGL